MRTSLNEIEHIERHLSDRLPGEESLLMEARMCLDMELAQKVSLQEETYALVRQYGRKKLKAEIMLVEKKLFTSPGYAGFKQRILSLFG
ncbi:MAG: hypothetical protein HEP71_18465 [Roseivirga sp.]|nr:hypothetical protein [Roseivirga sp.]